MSWSAGGGEVRDRVSGMAMTYDAQCPSLSSYQRDHGLVTSNMSRRSPPILSEDQPTHYQLHDEQIVRATLLDTVQLGCLSVGPPDTVH